MKFTPKRGEEGSEEICRIFHVRESFEANCTMHRVVATMNATKFPFFPV